MDQPQKVPPKPPKKEQTSNTTIVVLSLSIIASISLSFLAYHQFAAPAKPKYAKKLTVLSPAANIAQATTKTWKGLSEEQHKLQQLANQNRKQGEKLQELKNELYASQHRLHSLNLLILNRPPAAEQVKIKQLSSQLSQYELHNQQLSDLVTKLEGELARNKNKVAQMKVTIDALAQAVEGEKQQKEEGTTELATKLEAFQIQTYDQQAALDTSITALQSALENKERLIQSLEETLQAMPTEDQLEEFRQQALAKAAEAQRLESIIADVTTEFEKERNKTQFLEGKLEEFDAKIVEEKEKQELQQEISSLNEQIQNFQALLRESTDNLKQKELYLNNLTKEREKTKSLLEGLHLTMRELEAKEKINQEFSQEVEKKHAEMAALQEQLNATELAVKNMAASFSQLYQNVSKATDSLVEEDASYEKMQDEVQSFITNITHELNNTKEALESSALNMDTLLQQNMDLTKQLHDFSEMVHDQQQLKQQIDLKVEEINELTDHLRISEDKAEKIQEQLDKIQKKVQNTQGQAVTYANYLEMILAENYELHQKALSSTEANAQIASDLTAKSQEIEALSNTLKTTNENIDILRKNLHELEQELAEAKEAEETSAVKKNSHIENLTNQLEESHKKLDEETLKLKESTERELTLFKEQLDEKVQRIEELEKNSASLQSTILDLQEKLKAEQEHAEQQRAELLKQLDQMKASESADDALPQETAGDDQQQ